jgi:predicted phage baseplate assembly protein
VSDPGVTLIELFAWMVETLLFRLNQVPDLHYIKLMELIGLRLHEPTAAQVPITFWLTAPQNNDVIIPQGTEVATERREGAEPIVFAANDHFVVLTPTLVHCLSEKAGETDRFKDQIADLQAQGRVFYPFLSQPPQVGDALYLGFSQKLTQHVLALSISCETAGGAGVDPQRPPWIWEGWTGETWEQALVEFDESGGFNNTGTLRLFLPHLETRTLASKSGYWVRCRLEEPGDRPAYGRSPGLITVEATSMGGTVVSTHAVRVENEILGRSDGSPGQIFQLRHFPVLHRRPGETILVLDDQESWTEWTEVEDFGESKARDRHYTLDSVTGEIRFGPSLRQPDGDMRVYGAIPPRGKQVRFAGYRYGGGVIGNVQSGKLRVLKTSIPYIARVQNRFPALGGTDAESIDLAKVRAPSIIRARSRAVTADDYEFLAKEAAREVARVRCIQPAGREGDPSPGTVYLLVVPRVEALGQEVNPDDLKLPQPLKQQILDYLDSRRLLTVRLEIREPEYVVVSIETKVKAQPHLAPKRVEKLVTDRLYAYLNPFSGGEDNEGWPFGRDLYLSDVYSCVQQVGGVAYVEALDVFEVIRSGKEKARKQRTERITLPANSLLVSYGHQVTVT